MLAAVGKSQNSMSHVHQAILFGVFRILTKSVIKIPAEHAAVHLGTFHSGLSLAELGLKMSCSPMTDKECEHLRDAF